MNSESFLRHASLEYGIKASFYEDQREKDALILYGSLESDVLSGKFIKVFVPIMGLEDAAREKLCGVYEKDEAKADAEKDNQVFSEEFLMHILLKKQCSGRHYSGIKRRTRIHKEYEHKWKSGVNDEFEK